MNAAPLTPSFNRKAIIGFVTSVVALLALCIGFLPIPLTALICYPPGLLFGVVSFVLGWMAHREIRATGQGGKALAVIALYMGGFTILAMLCLIAVGVIFLPRIYEWLAHYIN